MALLFAAPASAVAAEIKAGVAKELFALPRGVPLAGYSKRHGAPSRGSHDPVGARALVVEDGQTTVALVSCDLLIIDEPLFDAVRRRLLAGGLPDDLELVLVATHTHSGPGAYGTRFLEKISMGHFDPAVLEELVRAITQAVLRAHGSLSPVRTASMSAMTDGLVKNRVDPDGLTDAELIVCAFYREAESTPFAILMNFAAHPTTLGAWNMEFSADYPGVAVDMVERRVSGSMGFFVAGAVGDQAPVKSGGGFESATRIGEALARQAVTLLESARPTTPRATRAAQELMALPPARIRLGSRWVLPRWLGTRLVDDDARLSIVAIGTTAFIGAPCDLSAELGRQLKAAARARGLDPVIVGFASDYIGYCMPRALYESRAYESLMALNGPDTGELVVSRLTRMLDDVVSSK